MRLYYSKAACSLAVRIVINELGLSSDYVAVNLKDKKTENGEDYLSINPKGAVPALLTDHGEVLTENNVIQQYLADHAKAFKLLPPQDDFNRYRVLEWSNYVSTELHKNCGALFNSTITQELKDTIFIPMLKKKLDFINDRLSASSYLAGDHFTLADAYAFVVLNWMSIFAIDLKDWPAIATYFHEVEQRASVQKSLREEGLR